MPLSAGKQIRSHKWLSRLGWALVLLGVLFFTPATELLPFEIFSALQSGSTQIYYRVVPLHGEALVTQPAFAFIGACFVFFGIAFIAAARLSRKPRMP